jgi:hypothetical protein
VTILTDTYIMPLHVLVKVILTNMWKNNYINETHLSVLYIFTVMFWSFFKKKLNTSVYNIF